LHEWVEGRPAALSSTHHGALADVAVLDELAARRRRFERAAKPSQGPPDDSFAAPQPTTPAVPVWSTGATEPGTAEDPITWLFDPESFAPMAKLVGDARYAIVTDHLGTPTAMYDAAGAEVWSATIDAYGDLRNITGTRSACPFRWPGQYEDAETGLYYNRFRYYDPGSGAYLATDPSGFVGGNRPYSYPGDVLRLIDPLGLVHVPGLSDIDLGQRIHDLTYRDKHLAGGGGTHGLVHRYNEQVTGAMRPGSPGWATHETQILNQQQALREALVEWEKRGHVSPPNAWKIATMPPPAGNQENVPRACKR
jgi:RHS repeat-associated protein